MGVIAETEVGVWRLILSGRKEERKHKSEKMAAKSISWDIRGPNKEKQKQLRAA